MKTIHVVAAVIRAENAAGEPMIFATQRGYGDFKDGWEFPGGKIEAGETPQQALVREIGEELDTKIQVGDRIDTIEYDYPEFHLSMDCFWAEIRSGELVLKEHEAAKWLTVDTLDSVAWLPADLALIDKVREGMLQQEKEADSRQAIFSFAENKYEEALALLRTIASVPAPTFQEEKKAALVLQWLRANGMPEAYQDEAGNVIFEYGTGEEVVICMAHMDVVFPDTTPFTIQERDGLWYTPGILDDNANLVCMLMAARYIVKHQILFPYRLVFVANVCEEGLGNLKGSKAIRDTFGSSIRRFIGFDAQLHDIVNHAVGSMRFRVTVRTEGGHSYTAFGNHNAIHQLAELICELYQVQVPTEARTTYNVGTIEGGTTVNSIAQQASMLYEFRSESVECLEKMQRTFDRIIEKYRHLGRSIEVETIGIRPCMKGVDPAAQEQLEEMGADLIRTYTDREPKRRTGSTDANTFQAYGIPSIVLGTAIGGSTHTREEWLDPKSLKEGLRLALGAVWQIW